MSTHTIGEVLNELKDEFDDITISKIRFLEAEGLISPDRTESGYRKFTEADIDRLRYVLRAQRDRYLPLKVIKEELDRLDRGLPVEPPPTTPEPEEVQLVRPEADGEGEAPRPSGVQTDVQLSTAELADATDLTRETVVELADHGLVTGEEPYTGNDLAAARAAAELLELGLEPRHLRMYRQFVDRQEGLAAQLVSPLVRQRNPDSREEAERQLEVFAREGARLHRALLDEALKALLRP